MANRSPRQAQLALGALKQVFETRRSADTSSTGEFFGSSLPRVEEREPRFLSWSEVEELAAACTEGRLILVACLTRLRQGELFALCDSSVDLELVSIAALGESAPADEAAGDGEEPLVDVGASFVADEQAAELV